MILNIITVMIFNKKIYYHEIAEVFDIQYIFIYIHMYIYIYLILAIIREKSLYSVASL